MEYLAKVTFHIAAFLCCCHAWQSTVDYNFKTSPTDGEQSSGQEGVPHERFKAQTTRTSRTTTYSSDGGSGKGETTYESTTYCSVDEQLEDIRTRLDIMEAHKEDKHCSGREQFVGFTVYLSRSMPSKPRHAIKFDHVIFNEGNGYDLFTGKFTVPVSGFYSLSFFISTEETYSTEHVVSQTSCHVRMMVDGVPTLSTVVKTSNAVFQNCDGGKTGVLKLFQGQQVWIEAHSNIYKIQGGYEDHVTSFSGALLHRI